MDEQRIDDTPDAPTPRRVALAQLLAGGVGAITVALVGAAPAAARDSKGKKAKKSRKAKAGKADAGRAAEGRQLLGLFTVTTHSSGKVPVTSARSIYAECAEGEVAIGSGYRLDDPKLCRIGDDVRVDDRKWGISVFCDRTQFSPPTATLLVYCLAPGAGGEG